MLHFNDTDNDLFPLKSVAFNLLANSLTYGFLVAVLLLLSTRPFLSISCLPLVMAPGKIIPSVCNWSHN